MIGVYNRPAINVLSTNSSELKEASRNENVIKLISGLFPGKPACWLLS